MFSFFDVKSIDVLPSTMNVNACICVTLVRRLEEAAEEDCLLIKKYPFKEFSKESSEKWNVIPEL